MAIYLAFDPRLKVDSIFSHTPKAEFLLLLRWVSTNVPPQLISSFSVTCVRNRSRNHDLSVSYFSRCVQRPLFHTTPRFCCYTTSALRSSTTTGSSTRFGFSTLLSNLTLAADW